MPEFKLNKQKLVLLIEKILKKVFEKNILSQKILTEVVYENKSCQIYKKCLDLFFDKIELS